MTFCYTYRTNDLCNEAKNRFVDYLNIESQAFCGLQASIIKIYNNKHSPEISNRTVTEQVSHPQ